MICAEYLHATQIILALLQHDSLPQVVLPAKPALVAMTLKSFDLPWRIVREGDVFTVVLRKGEP